MAAHAGQVPAQIAQRVDQVRVAGRIVDGEVEPVGEEVGRLVVDDAARGGPREKRVAELFEHLAVSPAGCQAGRLGLERFAIRVDVADRLLRERGDDHGSTGAVGHQALGGQARERFTDGRS